MTVIATARTRPPGTVEGGVTFVDTPTLLADSDVITVHTPLPPQANPKLRNLHPTGQHAQLSRPWKIARSTPRLLRFAMLKSVPQPPKSSVTSHSSGPNVTFEVAAAAR